MGKGDKKSKRGKIVLGTYGARRSRKGRKRIASASPGVEISDDTNELKKSARTKKKVTSSR